MTTSLLGLSANPSHPAWMATCTDGPRGKRRRTALTLPCPGRSGPRQPAVTSCTRKSYQPGNCLAKCRTTRLAMAAALERPMFAQRMKSPECCRTLSRHAFRLRTLGDPCEHHSACHSVPSLGRCCQKRLLSRAAPPRLPLFYSPLDNPIRSKNKPTILEQTPHRPAAHGHRTSMFDFPRPCVFSLLTARMGAPIVGRLSERARRFRSRHRLGLLRFDTLGRKPGSGHCHQSSSAEPIVMLRALLEHL